MPAYWRTTYKRTEIQFIQLIEPCASFASWTSLEDIFKFHLPFLVSDGALLLTLLGTLRSEWLNNACYYLQYDLIDIQGRLFFSACLYSSFQYTDSNFHKNSTPRHLTCKNGTSLFICCTQTFQCLNLTMYLNNTIYVV